MHTDPLFHQLKILKVHDINVYKLQYLCSDTRKIRYPKYLETFSYTIEMSIPTQHVPVTIFI